MKHLENQFARLLFACAFLSGAAFGVFVFCYVRYEADLLLTLAITAGVTFYHFAMRLFTGVFVAATFGRRLNVHSPWFRIRKFETRVYTRLKVKRWKEHLPSYDPSQFDLKYNSLEQIVYNTCQAEVVHEVIILLSFLPVLCTFRWGAFSAFFITSLISALVDSLFVMIQRFNRPRLIRILEKLH